VRGALHSPRKLPEASCSVDHRPVGNSDNDINAGIPSGDAIVFTLAILPRRTICALLNWVSAWQRTFCASALHCWQYLASR